MTEQAPPPPSRIRRRLAIGAAVVFGAYLLVGFLIVPRIVEQQLVAILDARTGGVTQLERAHFDPLRLRLRLRGFSLRAASTPQAERRSGEGGKTEPVLGFDELIIDARWTGFLTADAGFDEIILSRPRIRAAVGPDGAIDLVTLLTALSTSPTNPGAAEPSAPPVDTAAESPGAEPQADDATQADPLLLEARRIRIEGGRLSFLDAQRSPSFEFAIVPLDLTIEDFTTEAGGSAPYTLKLSAGEATRLDWTGEVGFEPLRSSGQLRLEGFDLGWPAAYLAPSLRFDVAQGRLDLEGRYEARFEAGLALEVREARVATQGVSLLDRAEGTEFLRLDALEVGPISADLDARGLRRLEVAAVHGSGGLLETRREADGSIRLVELFEPVPTSEPGPENPGSQTPDAESEPETESPAVAGSAAPPHISVGEVALQDFALRFQDRGPARPATIALSNLGFRVRGFESPAVAPMQIDFRARVGEEGEVSLAGPLETAPLAARFAIRADKIALHDFEPYLEQAARIDLPKGLLSGALDLALEAREAASPGVTLRGDLRVDELETLEEGTARKFVEWGSLQLRGIDFVLGAAAGAESPGDRIELAEIVVRRFGAHIVRAADGGMNLQSIFAPDGSASSSEATRPPATQAARTTGQARAGASQPAGAKSAPPRAIEIAKVTLDGVAVNFTDLGLEPNFTIDLGAVRGTIEGLSSRAGTRARVALAGKIDETAPVSVSGHVDPLSGEGDTDLEVRVSGVSMPAFSPYSGRYAGYAIDRGKLDLGLAYKLSARTLEAENRIALHQFDLGPSVKSDQATPLPLPLVVALLRNPSGDILLDVPLRGNLDDPSFDLFTLLGKTFVNLVTRIATSPFAIVGGLVDASAEELSRVAFGPGSDALTPEERAELATLARALGDRPALNLEIRGQADPTLDTAGLRAARVEQEIRQSLFERMPRTAREQTGDPAAMELDADTLRREVEKRYASRIGGDPETLLETAGSADGSGARSEAQARVEAMLAALGRDEVIGEADLRGLARARASRVQNTLIEQEGIDPARLFLVDVAVGDVARDGKVPTDLSLKPR